MSKRYFCRSGSSTQRREGPRQAAGQVPAATEFFVGIAALAGWFAGSAIIVAWLTCLPWLVEAASAAVNATPAYIQAYSSAETKWPGSNTALKGDRITGNRAAADKARVAPVGTEISRMEGSKSEISKSGRELPIGCESAFSRLTAEATLSARCLT